MKKVVITDSRIWYEEDPNEIVMDVVSKELMEAYASIVCQTKGQVLDVGFGLGYSATEIYNRVGNVTIIEANHDVYKRAIAWAADKPNAKIYFGDWVEVIPEMISEGIKFDGIFMDTFDDDNYSKFESYAKKIANEGCCLSIYSYFTQRDMNECHRSYFKIDPYKRAKYPKLIEEGHWMHWTFYKDKEFKKIKKDVAI
jgi:spermidine synthase